MAGKTLPAWKKLAKKRFLTEFNKYQQDTGKSLQKIADELDISISTIKDTIKDEDGSNFNADFVIAFCLKYKVVDINYIYTGLKDEPSPSLDGKEVGYTTFRHSADCHILEDEAFMGSFYGYCRSTMYTNIIDDFVLTIDKNAKNTVQATMLLNGHNQKGEVIQKYLYGKPMHLEPNIIYIVFQGDIGDDMFILSYNWFKISAGNRLYCRYGGILTPCRATNRYPQLQSFLLLDAPIPPEDMQYVDGFLNLTQDKILVPAHLYDADCGGVAESDENVKAFFNACNTLQYNKEEYYCFSEKVLLALGEANEVPFDVTAAAIMALKKISVSPRVVDFPNNKTYSKFFSRLATKSKDE